MFIIIVGLCGRYLISFKSEWGREDVKHDRLIYQRRTAAFFTFATHLIVTRRLDEFVHLESRLSRFHDIPTFLDSLMIQVLDANLGESLKYLTSMSRLAACHWQKNVHPIKAVKLKRVPLKQVEWERY